MDVNLWYLSPNPYGGWVTYTYHLFHSLIHAGYTPRLFKWSRSGRSEHWDRPFGYGLDYRNVAYFPGAPNLIVALNKEFLPVAKQMMELPTTRIVVHDPTEMKWKEGIDFENGKRCIVIREGMLKYLPEATFIRHPFVPMFPVDAPLVWKKQAISISRIDFDKHTEILLDANRIIQSDKHKIHIRGFENRIFTRFKIVPKYPEWVQSVSHWAREKDGAGHLAHKYRYMTDMSEIKNDGGGTQYSFLEAWDAGCVPVLNADWWRGMDSEQCDMKPGWNCRMVSNAEELADLLENPPSEKEDALIVRRGRKQLRANHDPMVIGAYYATALS